MRKTVVLTTLALLIAMSAQAAESPLKTASMYQNIGDSGFFVSNCDSNKSLAVLGDSSAYAGGGSYESERHVIAVGHSQVYGGSDHPVVVELVRLDGCIGKFRIRR